MQTKPHTIQFGVPGCGAVRSIAKVCEGVAEPHQLLNQSYPNPAAARIMASKTNNEIFIEVVESYRIPLILRAKSKFPRLSYEDIEEVFQDLLWELWHNGPAGLGIISLADLEGFKEAAHFFNCVGKVFEILLRRLKRRLCQLLVDLIRRRKRKIRGGESVHVDIDDMKEFLEGPCGTITAEECCETLKQLIEWLKECLSEREEIVAPIWLRYLPFRPTVDDLYEEMILSERRRFLPRVCKDLSTAQEEAAIKSQISRTRASLEAKVAEFGREHR